MAERRGGTEDLELKRAYGRFYQYGGYNFSGTDAQQVLTSKALKLKPKEQNVAGVQLADILAHPMTRLVLLEKGVLGDLVIWAIRAGPFSGPSHLLGMVEQSL